MWTVLISTLGGVLVAAVSAGAFSSSKARLRRQVREEVEVRDLFEPGSVTRERWEDQLLLTTNLYRHRADPLEEFASRCRLGITAGWLAMIGASAYSTSALDVVIGINSDQNAAWWVYWGGLAGVAISALLLFIVSAMQRKG
ncbi:hypothetical protein ACOACO_17600 [Nocardioides sp. CPCC 205120]|uniref:hypothetical protein n=1 Tax=Nocardioides sp. CPCC 205120 TaxID=3406462 RepID=UPI003B502CB1